MSANNIIEQTHTLIAPLVDERGALLPMLHALQGHFGYVPPEAVPEVAKTLNLSRAEVHGVISFYHWFRTSPGGAKTVYICRAESCQAMNSAAIETAAREVLGIDYHETTPDGRYNLEPVYCLGNCACSPAIMIDEQVHARVTPEGLRALLERDS
jgi:formate dehydrogenase subunit gamma